MREPHACERAKERYGIDLTVRDLREIARRCKGGEGHVETLPSGKRFHNVVWGERILQVVYMPSIDKHSDGRVLTIMPPGVAVVAARRAETQAARRRGHYRPRRPL